MRLHEEFKLYETMWEPDCAEHLAFDIDLYDGRKIRCAKCGAVCVYDENYSVPQEFRSWSTVFGVLCDACHMKQNVYEAAADRFLAVSDDVAVLDDLLQFEEGIGQVEEMINAWNKAKKDPRFIYTSFDISEIECNFIANALECNLKISPNVFNLQDGISKEDLNEWTLNNGNKVNTNSSITSSAALSNASTTTSNTPYRKKPISHEYNMLYADYSPEFTKLDAHIQNVHGKLANSWQYDKMIRDDIFRTYWVDKNGAEYRLEVTTTNVRSGEVVEHWDFVLEETEPNAHIIDRGYLMDYHHLLDKLLQYGVITDKSKCI